MNFIELTTRNGQKFLFDFDSGWEIRDNGEKPAWWTNNREGRNLDATETYASIRARITLMTDFKP